MCLRIIFACSVLFGVIACTEEQTPWDLHIEKGEQLLKKRQFAQAESEFKAALLEAEEAGGNDPRLPQSLRKLAVIYDIQGKYDQAEPLLKREIAIHEAGKNIRTR